MNNLDKLYFDIRKNIESISKEKRISEKELARLININENEFHDCRKLSINKLMIICKVLDIELYDLLKGEE